MSFLEQLFKKSLDGIIYIQMPTFDDEEALKEFLLEINPKYGDYGSALFEAEGNDPSIVGNVNVTDLVALGISRFHALDLIASCKAKCTVSMSHHFLSQNKLTQPWQHQIE